MRVLKLATGIVSLGLLCVLETGSPLRAQGTAFRFRLIEATIADVHRAIQERQITCRGLVQAYLNRARAYNGVAHQLVTRDGAPIPPAPGVVRAGAPLAFPTTTVKASVVFPDFDQYVGPPIELGRMEPTASDPSVSQQFGMIVGVPNAGQLAALATINIRGERSVTCKGAFDAAPSTGPLPTGAPAVCEELRKQPDALERAIELDERYGNAPDLAAMPMYCIPFTFKDSFDTRDMRTTGGGDARYDIDVPARDFTLVEQLRAKGAIIYAKAVPDEYNARAGNPGGPNRAATVMPGNTGYQRSTWGGTPANPYDTSRAAAIGSSSGSAVSVTANLAMCSICEETNASCRGPSNHNAQAMILPAKGLLSYFGGAIGNDMHNDRSGTECRTIADAAKVWDALKDPVRGYYDPRDVFTTVRRSSFLTAPYAASATTSGAPGSLKGLRIGVIRESMLTFPGVKADEPIVAAATREIREVLGAHLGASLVESVDPRWPDDPSIENMSPSYTRALTELLPVFFPDILYRLEDDGTPEFPEFAAKVKPTEFAPGVMFGSGPLAPVDYMVAMAEGRLAPPSNLNIRTIQSKPQATTFHFHFRQYAMRRAADWAARGFTETLVDFASLNARSKFWGETQRQAFKNWELFDHVLYAPGERQATNERAKLRELLARLDMKVMQENHLDVLVRLHTSLPPGKTGYPGQPGPTGDTRGESAMGPNAGLTEVQVPAGFVTTVYDPYFVLSADKRRYVATGNSTPTTLPSPGLPFSLVFRADPGREDVILKVASAYEAASKRRVPPPAFGPLPGEP
ncbi:MAG: amidase [Acidobacteria bacterium]|nr:amidase [Acidobacteriota bacterium]